MAGGSAIARASAIMASGTVVSRLLGLVKVVVLAYAIGQVGSISGDAYANGNMLPNLLYTVLLGGMLNAVLVPQIVKAAKNADGGRSYINKLVTFVTVALTSITVLMMFATPWIVTAFTLKFSQDQRELAISFAYWCMPQILFFGIYAVLGEVLNAKSVFGPSTWAPVLNNVIAIAGFGAFIYFFGADPTGDRTVDDWGSLPIAVLAGSATLGIASQALILFAFWRRAGIRFRLDFKWRGMGLADTGRIAGWTLGALLVTNLGALVTTNVINAASGEGVATLALETAWTIYIMPHSVITISIATAYFTRLAEWHHAGDRAAFTRDFSAAVRQVMLILVLAAVVVFAVAPFVSRVVNLGATLNQVDQFSLALRAYLVSLPAFSVLFVVQRAFYATSDTRTPFFYACARIAVTIALSLLALAVVPTPLLGTAVALVISIAAIVETILATLLLRRKLGSIDGRRIGASLARYLGAGAVALAAGLAGTWGARLLQPDFGPLYSVLASIVIALGMSVVYLLVLLALRTPELAAVIDRVRRR